MAIITNDYYNSKNNLVIIIMIINMVNDNIKNCRPDDDSRGDDYDYGVLQTLWLSKWDVWGLNVKYSSFQSKHKKPEISLTQSVLSHSAPTQV